MNDLEKRKREALEISIGKYIEDAQSSWDKETCLPFHEHAAKYVMDCIKDYQLLSPAPPQKMVTDGEVEVVSVKTLEWMFRDLPIGGEPVFLMDNFPNGIQIVDEEKS